MKILISNFPFPARPSRHWRGHSALRIPHSALRTPHLPLGPASAFTMIEIALCLAIIGIALVAIIGVLPIGMNTQRDTREETTINQDATVLLEDISNGVRGADDLTNYVYAITNYATPFTSAGVATTPVITYGFTFAASAKNTTALSSYYNLTNGANIIGLLTTPQFTDTNGLPIPSLNFGGISNHVVAYVRSLSGLAAEKPPQDNPIMVGDTFSYHIYCVNASVATDTNVLFQSLWQAQTYSPGSQVFYNWNFWSATATNPATVIPGQALTWVRVPNYALSLAANQHELRLTFLWPQLPNGNVGNGRQTFRATIAGQLARDANNPYSYFYQSQSFKPQP